MDFRPFHCLRKRQHRGANRDFLNKDSYFHLTEGEQRRLKAMFLSCLTFGEVSLYKKKSNIE